MSSLEEVIATIDLPVSQQGESMDSYARRVALLGAHAGVAWSMVHRPYIISHIPPPGWQPKGSEPDDGE